MHNVFSAKDSSLYAHYVIDGVRHDAAPAELLQECMTGREEIQMEPAGDIIDETLEPPLTSFTYDNASDKEYEDIQNRYAAERGSEHRAFNILYPEHTTRLAIAAGLMDMLWKKGHFRLGDLQVNLDWQWNWKEMPVGSMAAFYASVRSACEYIYDLGLRISAFSTADARPYARFGTGVSLHVTEESGDIAMPFESRHPWMEDERAVPDHIDGHADDSWVIYIPFDTCSYKLGGSLLAESFGHNGGVAPSIQDPDYFIDCYEVVRELVEDGIITAAATVADGGLMYALSGFAKVHGIDVDIRGLMSSYQTDDTTKVLFSEVPGVLMSINDRDFDYVDSQFLLQDVAYYPIGRISDGQTGIRMVRNYRSGISDILTSLLAQASEGED